MIVYHVTSAKKLARYKKAGFIAPPVRAWDTITQAERMSKSSGRRVIIRLRFPDNASRLDGHFRQARVVQQQISVQDI